MGWRHSKRASLRAAAAIVAAAVVLMATWSPPAPAVAAGTVSGVPAPGSYGLAVFSGGSFNDLIGAIQGAGCNPIAFYLNNQAGGFLTYVVGAASFVNAAAAAAYPGGLASLSPVLISCGTGATPVATPTPAPAPAGTSSVAVTLADFSIVPVPATAASGNVNFTVKNTGVVTHEMVLAKTDADPASLPTLKASDLPVEGHAVGDVNEAPLDSPGEVDAVAPGTSKAGMFLLQPGKYVLFCNVPGHYAAGMRTGFTVQGPAVPPPASTPAVAVSEKEWSIVAVPTTVAAGQVAFTVKNSGVLAHELVVVRTDVDPASLPTLALADGNVAGQIIGDVNEATLTTSINITTAAGATKVATVQLAAGKYALFCNLPGHYVAGMRTAFTVQ